MSCQAKLVWPGGWILCGEPTAAVYLYRCEHGHQRTGETCAAHDPVPQAVGCARCVEELGHDCPVTFELMKLIRRA